MKKNFRNEELFEEIEKTTSDEKRRALQEQVFQENMGLVHMCIRQFNKYRGKYSSFSSFEIEDLEQEACIALWLAIKAYDVSRGIMFSTYATSTIQGKLKNAVRDKAWLLKVPRRDKELFMRFRNAEDELYKYQLSFTKENFMQVAGFTEEEYEKAILLHQSLGVGLIESTDNVPVPCELRSESFEGDILHNIDLKSALSKLSETERKVFHYRFEECLSIEKTSQLVGISCYKTAKCEEKIHHFLTKWV